MAIEYYNAPSEMNEGGENRPAHARSLRRKIGRWGALIGALVLVGVIAFAVPMPYVITSPGPTYDVLGSMNSDPVIEIAAPDVAKQSEGQLRMVTVSSLGGPDAHVSLVDFLLAKLDPSSNVRPVEEVYPRDLTREELDELSKIQMTSSQSTAASVALEELGYDVDVTMTVAGATSGSHSEGVVEEGDVLQAIITPDGERHAVDRPSVPFALPKTLPPETPVKLEILRNGEKKTLAMRTYLPEEAGPDFMGSRFGIYLSADVKLPVDVTIHLENVGGPSAGLMFVLGIIDKFTGGDSTGGAIIAGTGAIGYDGEVQPIGGIVQKMYGSKRDGAQWFLAPKSNCDEVVGNIPDGLEVWPVSTLAEAREAVQAISKGATIDHPVCEAK